MGERREILLPQTGYLRLRGEAGRPAREMRDLLDAFEDAYHAADRVDLSAERCFAGIASLGRARPRPYGLGGALLALGTVPTTTAPTTPLVVHAVVLRSPGFWEFIGSLNPLEVLRQYLNDRHERRKDQQYRSAAECERLAIENAMRRIDLIERLAQVQREYGSDLTSFEAWARECLGELGPPLRRLGELDDRGLIDGTTAETRREPFEQTDETPT